MGSTWPSRLGVVYPDTEQPHENKLLLIDPTGAIVMEHVKYGGAIIEGNRSRRRKAANRDHALRRAFGRDLL